MLKNFSSYNESKKSISDVFYLEFSVSVVVVDLANSADFENSANSDIDDLVKAYCRIILFIAF